MPGGTFVDFSPKLRQNIPSLHRAIASPRPPSPGPPSPGPGPALGLRRAIAMKKQELTKGILALSMQALTGTTPTPAPAPAVIATPTKASGSSRRRHRRSRRTPPRSACSQCSRRSRSCRSGQSRRQQSPSQSSDSYSASDNEPELEALDNSKAYSGTFWTGDKLPRDCRTYGDILEKVAVEILHTLSAKRYLAINNLSRWIVILFFCFFFFFAFWGLQGSDMVDTLGEFV